jgi:hypothetical protein
MGRKRMRTFFKYENLVEGFMHDGPRLINKLSLSPLSLTLHQSSLEFLIKHLTLLYKMIDLDKLVKNEMISRSNMELK